MSTASPIPTSEPPGRPAPVALLTLTDLAPGAGADAVGGEPGWAVAAPHVRFTAPGLLDPGWYEVRIGAASADRFTIRKRLEVTFDPGDGDSRPAAREAFAWNRSFGETFMIRLTRPAAGVRVDVWHAEGRLTLTDFVVRRVSRPSTIARAVREKVRLTLAYRCFGPALKRGGRMLLSGRFREFGTKLLRGLTDARVMQIGGNQVGEIDGGWRRRHALPADEADRVRAAVLAMSDPPPFAVLVAVDGPTAEAAQLSAHSVRRQMYPHWHLLVAASGPPAIVADLTRTLAADPRVTVVRATASAGRAAAVAQALARTDCERIVVLPPGIELTEHALYYFAKSVQADPGIGVFGGRVAGTLATGTDAPDDGVANAVWVTKTRRLPDDVPSELTPAALGTWVTGGTEGPRSLLEPVLAYPPDGRPLLDRGRVGPAPTGKGRRLFLGADVRGIGGYDHVAFALLKGLASAGADLRMHPVAAVRADLVPPGLLPLAAPRRAGDPQLVMGPPFLVPRFGLDRASAVLTMWETDRFDPHWVSELNKSGLVIVPSQWQAGCFRADGITAPIAVAPLGFDPLVYHPVGGFPEVCTFGTAGALTAGGVRKNAQRVIDLFRRAFPTEADVRLRVKISHGSPGVETYDDPRVDVIRAALPMAELADWYRSLTAYVNASCGEGFGLHLIEAMACGRPLVTPCHTGLTAFFDPSIGYAVDYTLVPVRNEIYTGHWAEPSDDSLAAQMRRVYADRAEVERLGAASAARAKGFTWKAAGRQVVAALREYGLLPA
ncbi:glycosyltransferase [Fimbriiglobus ruber]|uniref:Glycosyl transferase family 1 protein-like n=1 Tax=Fimbriiglobus ruber TaxID=1908690 RepID=A0A225DIY5_9BACT|nr:glycosyltransferase [Fimbriiglobus ruber]OWK39664.1 Glycosyl transferase family 1 protein-like [Fimbriiglobus ruber]